jgi:hypothetical protein
MPPRTQKQSLGERDTIAKEEQANYDKFRETTLDQGDTYARFFYDRTHGWFKVHDANAHEVIPEKMFKGSGKAKEYLLQSPGRKAADFTLDGPVPDHDDHTK